MAPFLRNVCLLRLDGTDGEFEYRITGDASVETWGRSLVGLGTSALNEIEDGVGDSVRATCRKLLKTRGPIAVRGPTSPQRTYIVQERVYLPLRPDDATIEYVLNISDVASTSVRQKGRPEDAEHFCGAVELTLHRGRDQIVAPANGVVYAHNCRRRTTTGVSPGLDKK